MGVLQGMIMMGDCVKGCYEASGVGLLFSKNFTCIITIIKITAVYWK